MSKIQVATAKEVKAAINLRLDSFFKHKIDQAAAIDSEYADLLSKMHGLIMRGGKRMRPYLAYLGYVGSGGKRSDQLFDAACALEILHNFMLIHDDVMDRDLKRYGGLNIAGLYKRQFGEWAGHTDTDHLSAGMALLAGDINLSFAYEVIATCDLDPDTRVDLASALSRVIFDVGAGQQLDFLAPLRDHVDEDYLYKIYEHKSGIYSIQMPLEFGVRVAGAEAIDFSAFARPIGICFQLSDDLLGMYGDEEAIGKPILSDLKEGKRTVLMTHALAHADPEQTATLKKHLGNAAVGIGDLEETRQILISTGSFEYVKQQCQDMVTEAKRHLQALPLNTEAKDALDALANFVIDRNF